MPSDGKKKASTKEDEEGQYAAEQYAVNDYAVPADYTAPQGYYDESGQYATAEDYNASTVAAGAYDYSDPNSQYYADPNQYYYGYDYTTGTYTDPNAAATSATSYDQYYSQQQQQQQQQAYYDAASYGNKKTSSYYSGASGALPEAVTAIQSAATSKYNNNAGYGAGNGAASSNAPTSQAPKIYYPSTANANNPVGPIIITKSGYTGPTGSPATSSPAQNEVETNKKKKKKSTVRAAGGEVWEDTSLEDWDDNDFRLFAGDLGNEVTEELLYKAFSKYPSLLRTRVVRDTRTMKSRGFGFISFKDPDDFVRAWREMNGKQKNKRFGSEVLYF
jgi:hypothetical protein